MRFGRYLADFLLRPEGKDGHTAFGAQIRWTTLATIGREDDGLSAWPCRTAPEQPYSQLINSSLFLLGIETKTLYIHTCNKVHTCNICSGPRAWAFIMSLSLIFTTSMTLFEGVWLNAPQLHIRAERAGALQPSIMCLSACFSQEMSHEGLGTNPDIAIEELSAASSGSKKEGNRLCAAWTSALQKAADSSGDRRGKAAARPAAHCARCGGRKAWRCRRTRDDIKEQSIVASMSGGG